MYSVNSESLRVILEFEIQALIEKRRFKFRIIFPGSQSSINLKFIKQEMLYSTVRSTSSYSRFSVSSLLRRAETCSSTETTSDESP